MIKIKHLLFFILLIGSVGCKYDKIEPDLVAASNYPPEVGNILVKKCATSGCHNSISRSNAGGLDFSTWDAVFEGGRNGSSVIPFSVDNSYLLYSINTDSARGPVLRPTMPLYDQALSNDEYLILKNWIANGAPDKNGFVKFSDDPSRKKIYICMQGCDKVAVMDAKSKVIMRYVNVGNSAVIEAPHLVRISPDGQYWYVVFYAGSVLQKFRTSDDSFVGEVYIGNGDWNTIIFSPDGRKGFVNGTFIQTTKIVDLENMTVEASLSLDFPHGGFVTPDGHWLYLTSQNGNFFNKVDLTTGPFYDTESIVLVPGQTKSTASSFDPHEMSLSPDAGKYFVSCQRTDEVRVFNLADDSLIAVIRVGQKPQEFSVSETKPYIFVSCTEDPVSTNQKGKVYVINYNDLSVVTSIYAGYQPHGLAVNDDQGLVYVANLNADPNGPAPHHSSECGGRNGYLTVIDMNTLQMWNKTLPDGSIFQYRCELLSFPYYVSYRK